MEEKICEGCLKATELLFAGLCHDCFQELKASVGGIILPEEEDMTVVELTTPEKAHHASLSKDLFDVPMTEWLKQIRMTTAENLHRNSRNKLKQVRIGLCLKHPEVIDIELILEEGRKGIKLIVPARMNYGQVKANRIINKKDGNLQVDFYTHKVHTTKIRGETKDKRLATLEKLRVDAVVETRQDLAEVA